MIALSQRAQILRKEIAKNGGWMSRLDIAKATGKTRVMPHDVKLLEQMVADGMLEKQQRSVEQNGITDVANDYRISWPRRSIKRRPRIFHVFYRLVPSSKHPHIEIVESHLFKMVSGGKITNRNDLYSHVVADESDLHDPNLQIHVVSTEKKLTSDRQREIQRQVTAYLIVNDLI